MSNIKKLADIQCLINEAYSDKEPLTEEQKASKKVFNEYCEDIRKDLDMIDCIEYCLNHSDIGCFTLPNEKIVSCDMGYVEDFISAIKEYLGGKQK